MLNLFVQKKPQWIWYVSVFEGLRFKGCLHLVFYYVSSADPEAPLLRGEAADKDSAKTCRKGRFGGSPVSVFAAVFTVAAGLTSSRGFGCLRPPWVWSPWLIHDVPSLPLPLCFGCGSKEPTGDLSGVWRFRDSWSHKIQLRSLQSEANCKRCSWTIAI